MECRYAYVIVIQYGSMIYSGRIVIVASSGLEYKTTEDCVELEASTTYILVLVMQTDRDERRPGEQQTSAAVLRGPHLMSCIACARGD